MGCNDGLRGIIGESLLEEWWLVDGGITFAREYRPWEGGWGVSES
jgi:hypothetical protein